MPENDTKGAEGRSAAARKAARTHARNAGFDGRNRSELRRRKGAVPARAGVAGRA
jgi:hypothetical protein